MQSFGRGRVVPYAPQNYQVYNARRHPQNQQAMYMTYAPYQFNLPNLQQEPIGYLTYAPYQQYSEQKIGCMTYTPYPLYTQQEIGAHLLQDPMANDMVLHSQQDQNCFFQNHYRRETMLEYKIGEMVMVRCNQQKWLNGVIQNISTQEMKIWIIDANILVNVPLVILPTCVLKMTTYLALKSLTQIEPLWTITNHGGYQKILIQCVCPPHLSHCQLAYVLDNNVCAICKFHGANTIDMVSPWNCCHQVHNHCLQLQMQQCSTFLCPSCNESFSNQPNLLEYSSFARSSAKNGQGQQFDLQCPCGFKSTMIGKINYATIFCPNCCQHVNVKSMMTNMQSGEAVNIMDVNPMMNKIPCREFSIDMNEDPRAKKMQSKEPPKNMDLSHAFFENERKFLQSSKSIEIPKKERSFKAQDFTFEWPMQSPSSHNRSEAIEEGYEVNTSSLESNKIEERGEEPSYFFSYLQALSETFENNHISCEKVIAMRSNDQDLQPPSCFQKSLQDGSLCEPFHTHSTKIQNKQDVSLCAPHPTLTTPFQSERSNFQILLEDGSLDETPLPPISPIQRKQSCSQSSLQNNFKDASSSSPNIFFQNELLKDNTFDEECYLLGSHILSSSFVNCLYEDKSTENPKMDIKMTKTTIEGHKLLKNGSEPNTNIVVVEDKSLGKKASQMISSIVEIESPTIWKKANEIDINHGTIKDFKLKKEVSDTIKNSRRSEGREVGKRKSESNVTFEDTDVQNSWKKINESNRIIANSTHQRWEKKKVNEIITTIAASEGQNLEKTTNEPNSNDSTIQNNKLWKKESKLNTTIAVNERHILWKKLSAIDCLETLKDNEESKKMEKENSSNEFLASSSSAAPMHTSHFDGATKGQKLWRKATALDWSKKLVGDGEIKENKKLDSSMDPSSAPKYVNHFADFVKLAMGASSSVAKDIIASASTSRSISSSILNSPLPLESITPTTISPPPAFFTRASSLFSKAPTWIIHSKNLDEATSTSPTWITVIKDGVDSRKDDKQ